MTCNIFKSVYSTKIKDYSKIYKKGIKILEYDLDIVRILKILAFSEKRMNKLSSI